MKIPPEAVGAFVAAPSPSFSVKDGLEAAGPIIVKALLDELSAEVERLRADEKYMDEDWEDAIFWNSAIDRFADSISEVIRRSREGAADPEETVREPVETNLAARALGEKVMSTTSDHAFRNDKYNGLYNMYLPE